MKRIFRLAIALSAAALAGTIAKADPPAFGNGSIIVAEGYSAANTYPTSALPAIFHDWCNDDNGVPQCVPTVELEVVDAMKGRHLGYIYAWGQDFAASADGASLNFREFILYKLDGGDLYTISQDGGHPGGAFADPSIVMPKVGDQVLVGGAEGQVVGGTGKYSGAGGGYSTRLKVEVDFASGFFIYYDELYFRFRDVKVGS